MKINPFTGKPLPENEYVPRAIDRDKVQALKLKQYGVENVNNDLEANLLTNGVDPIDIPTGKDKDYKFGKSVLNNAGNIANFGMEEYANFKNVSGSTKESQNQMLGTTLKGAQLGLSIGGPWGAAIGAVGGAIIGGVDLKADQKKRVENEDKKNKAELDKAKAYRKNIYNMQQGEQITAVEYGTQEKYYNPYGNS